MKALKLPRFALRTKVTVLLLALSVTPLIVNGVVNESRAVEHGLEEARRRVAQTTQITARAVGIRFVQLLDELRLLARVLPITGQSMERLSTRVAGGQGPEAHLEGWRSLQLFVQLDPIYLKVFLAQPDGQVVFATPYLSLPEGTAVPTLADSPWFETLTDKGGIFLGDFGALTPPPSPSPVAVVPLTDDEGRQIAWLGVVLDRARLTQVADLHRQEADEGQQLMLVDPVGVFGAHTDPRQIGDAAPRWLAAALARGEGTETLDALAEERLAAHYAVPGTRWHVVLTVPTAQAYRSVYGVVWFSTVFVLLTFIFVLLFANMMADLLLRPLHDLEQGAEMLGAGALDYRIKLESHGDDELGRLAGTFNRMGDNLQDTQRKSEAYARNLEVAHQELDVMVYAITHDLKKSLRGIEAFSNFLREDYSEVLDEEGQDLLNAIVVNVHRINHLADDLIGLVDDEREGGERSRFGMEGLLRDARERALEQHRGEVKMPDQLPSIMADRPRLLLVFVNLISNGLKFNESERPMVTITYEDLGVYWEFNVVDNGIGIEPRYHDQVFEMFSRLNHMDEYDGTGTGLNLARRIVEEHRGTLNIDSEPGEGTRFIVTLPKDPALLTSPGVADL